MLGGKETQLDTEENEGLEAVMTLLVLVLKEVHFVVE